MPPKARHSTETITDRALARFWSNGYHATSIDDLVAATGSTRHSIYGTYGGKRGLFLACFDHYQDTVVTPAFERVEQPGAALDQIRAYFEFQITQGSAAGLPGPGCFVANSATEVAPADPEVAQSVQFHNDRLKAGFLGALHQEASARAAGIREEELIALAELLVIFTSALWSQSRSIADADALRGAVTAFLSLIDARISE